MTDSIRYGSPATVVALRAARSGARNPGRLIQSGIANTGPRGSGTRVPVASAIAGVTLPLTMQYRSAKAPYRTYSGPAPTRRSLRMYGPGSPASCAPSSVQTTSSWASSNG